MALIGNGMGRLTKQEDAVRRTMEAGFTGLRKFLLNCSTTGSSGVGTVQVCTAL
jgi:hypothetical protein